MPRVRDRRRTAAVSCGLGCLTAGLLLATQIPEQPASHAVNVAPIQMVSPAPSVSAQPSSSVRTQAASPGVRIQPRASTPVRLQVPRLGVDVRPRAVGRHADGRLRVPANARAVAWWAFGSGPGERQGTVVLAGHVSWHGRWGTFARLTSLPAGARVRLGRLDGRAVEYEVVSVVRVRKARLDELGLFATTGSPEVVLVTCGGRWDPGRRSYEDNVVVCARPV